LPLPQLTAPPMMIPPPTQTGAPSPSVDAVHAPAAAVPAAAPAAVDTTPRATP